MRPLIKATNSVLYSLVTSLTLVLSACSQSDVSLEDHSERNAHIHRTHAVVTSNKHASEIGREILRAGGNAMDAAVASQIALTFVEPHETGLGGGGFMLYFDAESGEQFMYDGREIAPATAEEDWFQWWGWPLHHYLAVTRGRSVGVPGMLAMLHKAHQDHGQLEWNELFTATIELADAGIPMPPRLQRQMAADRTLGWFGDVKDMFETSLGSDEPRLRNPELAATLSRLAAEGPDAFYLGSIGDAYRARAAQRWPMRGELTAEDFASYEAVLRDPLCGEYRGWRICSAAAPSSGSITMLQILGMLEPHDVGSMQPDSPEFIHLYAEASRLAFADRQYYIGDPAFATVDGEALVNPDYLAQRSRLIRSGRAARQANPGEPYGRLEIDDAEPVREDDEYGTSHLSVVDSKGNAVALTGSIEAPFGSRMVAAGLMLNNQLTDFAFEPTLSDRLSPNRVEPGKRPRSSMAPTFIFNAEGELTYILGSRGGSRIIGYVTKTVIGIIDWQLSLQRSIDLPNLLHRGERLEVERGTNLQDRVEALEALGHEVDLETLDSGVHGIERVDDGWRGAADKRMEGAVYGD
ncbi:gamma-glutamyltransferase [Aliidiomarina sedimenti]|uniref:Glutathione hydrolase proenzyme n=1 Tax=Aliidiomarina sedimenti TaxID=1933879 RepID=A0ABY0C0V7_9GAMM|nr:gamma-glutamyltransferase [Aliidiomarina sedimenti]RUO30854.1 gamma-glutamyltransferase [Aliidiomarina sedimenti]